MQVKESLERPRKSCLMYLFDEEDANAEEAISEGNDVESSSCRMYVENSEIPFNEYD